jgi:transcriptional regulator with XRE-family HTH domain
MQIYKIRRGRKMTQADLALAITQIMGADKTASQASVSRWERGLVDVSMRYETPLAQALNVPESMLFDPPPPEWQIPGWMLEAFEEAA